MSSNGRKTTRMLNTGTMKGIDMDFPLFSQFPKMARLSREIVITEKIDGTNAQVLITDDGKVFAGSRTRWITPQDDNYGFARWVDDHRDELLALGPGQHFGEWWGKGINRNYGLDERRFSLFNVRRWALHGTEPKTYPTLDPRITKTQYVLPACCGLVPVLYEGLFTDISIYSALRYLEEAGSQVAPGFMKPEGIVVFHTAANMCFKKTIEKDAQPKGIK